MGRVGLLQSQWFFARLSRRFVLALTTSLLNISHGAYGHHEGLTVEFCLEQPTWCSLATPDKLGNADTSPTGYDSAHTLQLTASAGSDPAKPHVPKPHRLYHPVKCAADDALGAAALQWLSWDSRCWNPDERDRWNCNRELRELAELGHYTSAPPPVRTTGKWSKLSTG